MNTITTINYSKAFQLFIGSDVLRPDILTPFKQCDKYFATDAMAMIILPINEAELNYPERERPKCDAIIPKEETMNIEMRVSELEEKLIPEMIEEFTEEEKETDCAECRGDGEVEFEYDTLKETFYYKTDCPGCEGSGTIKHTEEKPTGKTISNPSQKYKMMGTGFHYWQLKRLVDACKIMEVETIVKTYGTERNVNLFKCGKATIMIMPIMYDGVPDSEYIFI